MVSRGAGLVGPALAGVLIAALGTTSVIWIDAATFLVSAGIVALGIPNSGSAADTSTAPAFAGWRGYVRAMAEGFRFIRGDRLIFWLIAVFALAQLLAEPLYSVVLPVYAREVFGSAVDLGVMYAALAAGSLAGNVLFLWLAPRLPRRATIVAGFAVRALMFWILVPLPPLEIIVAAIFVSAVVFEPTNPIWMTILQERVPEEMRGRVFGSLIALGSGMRALGLLTYGLLLAQFGLRETLVAMAVVNLGVPLLLWLAPPLRTLDRARAAPTSSAVRSSS
jgi:MFS family permease